MQKSTRTTKTLTQSCRRGRELLYQRRLISFSTTHTLVTLTKAKNIFLISTKFRNSIRFNHFHNCKILSQELFCVLSQMHSSPKLGVCNYVGQFRIKCEQNLIQLVLASFLLLSVTVLCLLWTTLCHKLNLKYTPFRIYIFVILENLRFKPCVRIDTII